MKYLCENIQGCVLGYTQSDEITLILVDYQNLNSCAWFDYEVQKMCSISASMATMAFNKFFTNNAKNEIMEYKASLIPQSAEIQEKIKKYCDTLKQASEKGAMFDARCFSIPKEEVANLIYWRQLDATRNSIQMVGQANFSHKELQNKSCNQIQDMLFQEKGINWNDFPTHLKRGSCCIKKEIQDGRFAIKDGAYPRSHWEIDLEIPIFKKEGRQYINKRILYEEPNELIDRDKQIQQFINENCTFCGTQSCVCYLNIADEEAISNCDNYHGEIPGIPKIKSLTEQFEDWMRETNTTWDDIRKKLAENKLKRE